MICRPHCGACCIAPSISSAIPGMPQGKPAGVRCIHLTDDLKCASFNYPQRPRVCIDFNADREICGDNRDDALRIMNGLEG